MCKTSEKDVSCLVVKKELAGLSFGSKESKMGWKASPTSMVFYDNVKVDKRYLLGQTGKGFNLALDGLNGGRISIASCSLGGATLAMNIASEYAQNRHAFKQPIWE